jgi:hypothetical protein
MLSSACRLLLVSSCLAYSSTLKMKAICCFETSGSVRTTDRDCNCEGGTDKEAGMETDLPTVYSISSEYTGH